MRVTRQNNIGGRSREIRNWNHREGFVRLCSLVDDYVTKVSGRNVQRLE